MKQREREHEEGSVRGESFDRGPGLAPGEGNLRLAGRPWLISAPDPVRWARGPSLAGPALRARLAPRPVLVGSASAPWLVGLAHGPDTALDCSSGASRGLQRGSGPVVPK